MGADDGVVDAPVSLAIVATASATAFRLFRTLRNGMQPHPANDITARMDDSPVNSKSAENRGGIRVNPRLRRHGRTGATIRCDQEIHRSQNNSWPKLFQK